jgi:hypothetical protein
MKRTISWQNDKCFEISNVGSINRRIVVKASLGIKQVHISKKKQSKKAGAVSQTAEH